MHLPGVPWASPGRPTSRVALRLRPLLVLLCSYANGCRQAPQVAQSIAEPAQAPLSPNRPGSMKFPPNTCSARPNRRGLHAAPRSGPGLSAYLTWHKKWVLCWENMKSCFDACHRQGEAASRGEGTKTAAIRHDRRLTASDTRHIHKSSGVSPVRLAIRANIRGPISSCS